MAKNIQEYVGEKVVEYMKNLDKEMQELKDEIERCHWVLADTHEKCTQCLYFVKDYERCQDCDKICCMKCSETGRKIYFGHCIGNQHDWLCETCKVLYCIDCEGLSKNCSCNSY